jgi:chemotaxis protein MotB
LNDVDNAISLAGHTDAVQYAGGERGYSNWELSADRANASRRELVAGGMKEQKILRVVGLGSSLPLLTDDPANPQHRRISLVVLNDRTERQIRGLPEPEEEVMTEAEAAALLGVDYLPAEEGGEPSMPADVAVETAQSVVPGDSATR